MFTWFAKKPTKGVMSNLNEYYKNIQDRVSSSAKEYAEKLQREKAAKQITSLRFVSTATEGVTALDTYTAKVTHMAQVGVQREVLARALLTGIYGVQCRASVLASTVSASFSPTVQNPHEGDASLENRLESALITLERINKLLKFVANACASVQHTNTHAARAISLAIAEVDKCVVPEELKVSLSNNNWREQATADHEKITALLNK